MMSGADVIEVIAALELAGVAVWINGGWGVDALVGEQTRPHDDLDVFISSDHIGLSQKALLSLGFELMTDELPVGFVLRDVADRRVDFHPLDIQPDGRGLHRQLTGEAWEFPAAGFGGSGVIHGTAVRCIPIEEQVREHAGYELREVDRHDLALLRRRLGMGTDG